VHGAAAAILRAAGHDEGDVPLVRALAEALLGPGAVVRVPGHALRVPASIAIVQGRPRIYLRAGSDPVRERFLIAHELAEWALERDGYREPDIEDAADAIGAALVAPRRAFAAALRDLGERYDALAATFLATESLVALRVGETQHEPRALVTPQRVRARGPESWAWPDEHEIRRAARTGRPGLRRTKLTDDPRRVVLRAVG